MPNHKLALFLPIGAALLSAGCSGNSPAVPCTTDLLLDLQVATELEGLDLVVDEVLWTITGNGMAPTRSRFLD